VIAFIILHRDRKGKIYKIQFILHKMKKCSVEFLRSISA